MNKVYFSQELNKNALKKELEKEFKPGEKIAIKLHMGEKGNKTALKPLC